MNDDLYLLLESYLSVRTAQGFKTGAQGTLLRDFIRFVQARSEDGPIRAELALDWAHASSVRRGSNGAASRLTVARGFLNFLRATVPDTEVPDYQLLATPRRPKPYLFTPEQIAGKCQNWLLKLRPMSDLQRVPAPVSLCGRKEAV